MIRIAQHSDALRLAEITVRCWQISYQGFVPPEIRANQTPEPHVAYMEYAVADPSKRTWVYEQDSTVLGYAHIGEARDDDVDPDVTAELWSIYVDPDDCGRGIGSELIATAVDSMRDHNYTDGVLWTLRDNEGARRFYQRHGWTDEDHRRTITTESGFELAEVRYRIDLTA